MWKAGLNVLWAGLIALSCFGVRAETLKVVAVASPDLVEVIRLSDGAGLWWSDLAGLQLPIRAVRAPEGRLSFRFRGVEYEIERADVTLADERRLVVDACNTVPVSLPSDHKQASVKGAGEGCRK
ncbi:hypothetical protein [Castellaniella sp.]|uniref:hypothetical protein n=1 Tax=Castellaniella sp. TaxID=1955812 RepID=UPI003C711C35